MIMTWPPELPRPERDTWKSQPQDVRRKSQPSTGPALYRRKSSSPVRNVTLSLLLNRHEKAVFDNFRMLDCAQGSLLFWMPDPTIDGWQIGDEVGTILLEGDDTPILDAELWLCGWGEDTPIDTVVGTEFRVNFAVQVMP